MGGDNVGRLDMERRLRESQEREQLKADLAAARAERDKAHFDLGLVREELYQQKTKAKTDLLFVNEQLVAEREELSAARAEIKRLREVYDGLMLICDGCGRFESGLAARLRNVRTWHCGTCGKSLRVAGTEELAALRAQSAAATRLAEADVGYDDLRRRLGPIDHLSPDWSALNVAHVARERARDAYRAARTGTEPGKEGE